MDRFKSNGFRRLTYFFILSIIVFLSLSCSNYKKVKIEIVDSNNVKLDDYEISIVGYLDKKIENGEELVLNLKKQEYLIRVFKDNYFPYQETFDINNLNEIVIKIRNIDEGIEEINQKLLIELENLKSYYVDFSGKIDSEDISFNAFFDFNNNIIKVNSKILNKEIVINKVDSKYVYNNNDLPEETQKYFGEIVKIIEDSVIFIKDLPLKIENKNYKSSNGNIIVEFEDKNVNLEIYGFVILDGFNLSFKNESFHIKTVDEMKRESEIYLYFYLK
ncbi:MAG TPA: hypothetical protein P5272_05490 [Caldisericia bacterium]|mgnify:FL=1|nr:hypothetical protein [Caldisericia bacterium]HOL83115.1 hypothetical protein [Caldisericia bacterium]HPC56373.1 hypothetical protein [Caldisericia bacterium]HPP43234.1 hypothetical protein [Caldisericia bacterium]HRT37021.1 hypothetical protein [Caldisericia bacterium]